MEQLNFPDFLNTEEKYNKLIRETNTLQKFEEIYLKLLADEDLQMSTILALMKIIECDVIFVNNLTEASSLMEMTESFIKYMSMKDVDSHKTTIENKKPEEEEKDKTPKTLKKTVKKKTQKGNITCDCGFPDKHQN